jgi:PHD/YefM family antitoxin component YafN of YafNO toxin-antitoxin module
MSGSSNHHAQSVLDDLLAPVDESGEAVVLVNSQGHRFVVMREEDYRGWRETQYLLSSSANARVLREAREEPLEESRDLKDVFDDLAD